MTHITMVLAKGRHKNRQYLVNLTDGFPIIFGVAIISGPNQNPTGRDYDCRDFETLSDWHHLLDSWFLKTVTYDQYYRINTTIDHAILHFTLQYHTVHAITCNMMDFHTHMQYVHF